MIHQSTLESKLAIQFVKNFIKTLALDSNHRPQGTIISWNYQHSLDWFNKKNHFKSRSEDRKTSETKSLIKDPVGWTQRYVTLNHPKQLVNKSDLSTHLLERGHLAPYWVTQSDSDQNNLILLTQYTNKGFESDHTTDNSSLYFGAINPESMLAIESEIRHFVIGAGCKDRLRDATFQVLIKPLYLDDNYVPFEIQYTVQLIGQNKKLLSFEFLGKQVSSGHCLQLNIPVQLSDGTHVAVYEKKTDSD